MADDSDDIAKRWALAATAVLTTMTRRAPRHDLLGGTVKSPETEETARTILANSWDIGSREALLASLGDLATEGHSAAYRKASAALVTATPEQQQADEALAFAAKYGAEIGSRALLAWDLGRLISVAGWGYLAGFHTEAEAWAAALAAGARLRNAYASWDEYGKHYRLGCIFWEEGATAQVDGILAKLASEEGSPWRTIPWRFDDVPASKATLSSPGAPPPGAAVPPSVNVAVVSAPAPKSPTNWVAIGVAAVVALGLIGYFGSKMLRPTPHPPAPVTQPHHPHK